MRQTTHRGLRAGTARQQELTARDDLIRSAPTEPEAFLQWGAQRQRDEGVCADLLPELLRVLDGDDFEIGAADFAAGKDFTEKLEEYTAIDTLQTYLICSRDEPRAWAWQRQPEDTWPGLPAELVGRAEAVALGGLGVELSTAAIVRSIPDAPTLE